jgi:hypothetical protein
MWLYCASHMDSNGPQKFTDVDNQFEFKKCLIKLKSQRYKLTAKCHKLTAKCRQLS